MGIVVARRAITDGEDIPPSWRRLTTKMVYTTDEEERVGEESSRAATAVRKTILCHQNDDEDNTRTMPHGKNQHSEEKASRLIGLRIYPFYLRLYLGWRPLYLGLCYGDLSDMHLDTQKRMEVILLFSDDVKRDGR